VNIAEGQRLKALEAEVESLKREVKDLTRRADDQSKAHRILADQMESKKLKKGEAA
jgi:hypothetical protein